MDPKFFLKALKLTNQALCKVEINRAYNSVGSNIFFKFGRQIEETLPNGNKTRTSEWTIWISNASWRMTKRGKYIVGSDDNRDIINKTMPIILGKQFHSMNITSSYLDAEFIFEDDYKIHTFFNWSVENQWLLFLPNKTEINIDCSSEESIKTGQALSKQLEVKDSYKNSGLSLPEVKVNEMAYTNNKLSKFIFSNDFFLEIGNAAWRLEKEGEYYLGSVDFYFGCQEGKEEEYRNQLSTLVGKKLSCINVANSGMDARFQFEGRYILEVFTDSKADSWKVFYKGKVLFCAN